MKKRATLVPIWSVVLVLFKRLIQNTLFPGGNLRCLSFWRLRRERWVELLHLDTVATHHLHHLMDTKTQTFGGNRPGKAGVMKAAASRRTPN
jgi:hypothetical protein